MPKPRKLTKKKKLFEMTLAWQEDLEQLLKEIGSSQQSIGTTIQNIETTLSDNVKLQAAMKMEIGQGFDQMSAALLPVKGLQNEVRGLVNVLEKRLQLEPTRVGGRDRLATRLPEIGDGPAVPVNKGAAMMLSHTKPK